MGYKKAVISIIAIIIVTWILISSLSTVPVIKSSSSGSGSGNGGGSGSSSGAGSGLGSGLGFNFPTFNLKLPNLNLNLGSLFKDIKFNFKFPKFNLTLPPTNLNSTKTNTSSSSSGGGGGNSGHGSSNNVANKIDVVEQILLNPIFLIIAVGIVGVLLAVFIIKNGGKHPKKQKDRKVEKEENFKETFDSRDNKKSEINLHASDVTAEQIPGKTEVLDLKKFQGWGGNGFIKPEIPPDMPLIWKASDNLDVKLTKAMDVSSRDPKFQGSLETGTFNMGVNKGINRIIGKWNEGNEEKDVYGINIWENAQKQMIGNMGKELMNELRNNTLREIIKSKEFSNMVENVESSSKLIKMYEKIYYGNKKINIKEYYDFLRYLKESLKNPRMYL